MLMQCHNCGERRRFTTESPRLDGEPAQGVRPCPEKANAGIHHWIVAGDTLADRADRDGVLLMVCNDCPQKIRFVKAGYWGP